ncbi:Ribosomal protein L15 [Aphelenchoides besseyi]|nr:Ribosomal protein L15 [Aphelenchoides besseyi]
MGAYKYMQEIWRKKQSDVMRYLLRIRTWHYRQLTRIHRCPRPTRPEKARRLGYKAKQGYVIYRVRVLRGGRKRPVTKGQTYGKPKTHGVNELKFARNLQSVAEERVGRRCSALRVLNSYWVGEDSVYKFFEVILIDPFHPAIRNNADTQWITKPVHKHRELRGLTSAGRKSRGIGKGLNYNKTTGGSRRANWKRRNTFAFSMRILGLCRQSAKRLGDSSILRRDVLHFTVKSGAGGKGVPVYNGIGGNGGSVYVRPVKKANFFQFCQQYAINRSLKATSGADASKVKLVGEHGNDVVINVPLGVECVNSATRMLLARCVEVNKKGEKGEVVQMAIHLKLTTNVGFIGLPNAGKSTLLNALVPTKKIKIADYPFTTLHPQVLNVTYELNEGNDENDDDPGDPFSLSVADLPGIIEGASLNRGRGYAFLKHLEHSDILIMVVDVHGFKLSSNSYDLQRNALESVGILNSEMENYDKKMISKSVIMVLNKIDLPGGQEKADELMPLFAQHDWHLQLPDNIRPKHPIRFAAILPLSAKTGNVGQLKVILRQLHNRVHPLENVEFEKENTESLIV